MKIIKKVSAIFLSALLAVTFIMPVSADTIIDITASNAEGDKDTSIGTNVAADAEILVHIGAVEGHVATVTDNHNITATGTSNDNITGLRLEASDADSLAFMTLNGNVTVNPDAVGDRVDTGIDILAGANSLVNLDMTGNVDAGLFGVNIKAQNNSTTNVDINGNISAHNIDHSLRNPSAVKLTALTGGKNIVDITGTLTSPEIALDIYTGEEESENTVMITGNIISTGDHAGIDIASDYGAQTHAIVNGDVDSGNGMGIDVGTFQGEADIMVNGNVNSQRGVKVRSNGGYTYLGISGDAVSNSIGAEINSRDSGGANLIVEGVLDGDDVTLQRTNTTSVDDIYVTVWKATTNRRGNVAEDENGNVDRDLEQAVNYIIKMNQPTHGATINVTKEDGSALAQVAGVTDVWNVANEGQKILVKIDVESGYKVTGVYGNEGQEMPLVKDANGDYYVIMPKGGGIELSVALGRNEKPGIPVVTSVDDLTSADKSNTSPAISWAEMILNAPTNGTVTIDMNGATLIPADVIQAMMIRRDVTVCFVYMFDGALFATAIPAGSDLSGYSNGTDIVALVTRFGSILTQ